jgi:hypothetical protein
MVARKKKRRAVDGMTMAKESNTDTASGIALYKQLKMGAARSQLEFKIRGLSFLGFVVFSAIFQSE